MIRRPGVRLRLVGPSVLVLSAAAWQGAAPPVFSSVSAGGAHTCSLAESGAAHCWGLNLWGQLGSGAVDPEAAALPPFGPEAYGEPGQASVSSPTPVATDLVFALISAGDRHSCALTHDGKAYCWGHNGFGQLGDGTTEHRARPMPVAGGLTFSRVSAGGTHTCGVSLEGTLYCWGGNWHGQAGVGRNSTYLPIVTSPIRVASSLLFKEVTAGGIHTCGLDAEGLAHCWGDRRAGVLGTGRDEPEDVFTPRSVATGDRYRSLSAGPGLTCAITVVGVLQCWGRVPRMSADTVALAPLEVIQAPALPIRQVSAGPGHVCAVSEQLTLIGLGTSAVGGCAASPGDPAQVREVSAGGNAFNQHTCALMEGGHVRCWGDDSRGQLGG